MYDKIAIVRKIDDGMSPPVNALAEVISSYGAKRGISVYDHHEGTNLPNGASDVLFVSLGGDGTLLYAANVSMQYDNASIVGFNLGNLGFLTDEIDKATNNESFRRVPNEVIAQSSIRDRIFEYLDDILIGDTKKVKQDVRMMLDMRYWIDGGLAYPEHHYAMNEITVYTSVRNFMYTTAAVNGMPVSKFGGNGVAVTTSTGSTALGFSAGGAIISPDTQVMQIVPLLPHKAARQPIITSGANEILLRSQVSSRTRKMYLLADSRQVFELDYDNDQTYIDITVKRAKKTVTLWRPANWNFFDVLSQKMDWN